MRDAALIIIMALSGVIVLFAATDSFGVRCAQMFPSDPIARERCVFDMSRGERP